MNIQPLFNESILAANWDEEYRKYIALGEDLRVLGILQAWAKRKPLKEKPSQAAFMQHFFQNIWGYQVQGNQAQQGFNMYPEFPVPGAGQCGGTGGADLALGNFAADNSGTAQVMCEFKDIHSGLDTPQPRKGNNRSPVRQALDYLREERSRITGNELVEPTWAIVTDMNEFRLYCCGKWQTQCQRFVICPTKDEYTVSLLEDSESGKFQRFLFQRLFHKQSLLSERKPSSLYRLLTNNVINEQGIEKNFYLEYKAYREFVFKTLVTANQDFCGSKGKLVRLTQRLLDRCLFILFCEDMGRALSFPPNLFQEELIRYSTGRTYGEEDAFPWDRLKSIFHTMNVGGAVGREVISPFNGGLFKACEELEELRIPAKVFCAENQGENENSLLSHPLTLLFFSAKYNFGIRNAAHEPMIDLYALGRIFEQSITELEIMEAEADGRPSLNLLTKRKRDGVYYTPEWVTGYIVEQVLGTRMDEIKESIGLTSVNCPSPEEVAIYRKYQRPTPRRRGVSAIPEVVKKAVAWLAALRHYRDCLKQLRIVDPACGSGAFLIQSLDRLKKEYAWIASENERIMGQQEFEDWDQIVNMILSHNIYGVDINSESVEITKLALWMHTATPGKPLSSLDHNIQCGNSLVGPDFAEFYRQKHNTLFERANEAERERINAFDWKAAFPEVFAQGGFDCVIGNPPYVKLQNFRRVQSDVAEYLSKAKRQDGTPLYASTQSGSFDLYLPFIEKGIELLKPEGRMGYIAPNVWMMNEYGQPLRSKMKENKNLDRWVDFKSFQVFEEAITYTALQFFHGTQCDTVRCAFPPDVPDHSRKDVENINWDKPDAVVPYAELPDDGAWNLLPNIERQFITRLNRECKPLGCEVWTRQIFQGLITSADSIYHLKLLRPGVYKSKEGVEVSIENGLMRPLISGPEAKRYQAPKTDIYLLFPYKLDEGRPRLCTADEMAHIFPNGWAYLRQHEAELRARENGSFNDTEWYRFGRNQNLDKQASPKLCVAQTVPNMRVCFDSNGDFFFNNVRVNGILTDTVETGWYILGILNTPLIDFVFHRTAKYKDAGWFEANKQFIAPLPIPNATDAEKQTVGNHAKRLQGLHTSRRDLMDKFDRRLQSPQMVENKRPVNWLWADIRTLAEWRQDPNMPNGLAGRALTAWAKEQYETHRETRLFELNAHLHAGALLVVENDDDELRLLINGNRVIELFDQPRTPFIAAQWRQIVRSTNITEAFDAKKLVSLLLNLRATDDNTLATKLVEIDSAIQALDTEIATAEAEINTLIYSLYHLTPEEITMINKEK